MPGPTGPILRFEPDPPSPDVTTLDRDDVRVAVLDTAWTPTPEQASDGTWIGVRETAATILADLDLLAEATRRLDEWVSATTVIDDMSIDGTSLWFYVRLHDHGWLQQRMLWALIVDALVHDVGPSRIELAQGGDAALVDVAPLVARRDGIAIGGALAPIRSGLGIASEADVAPRARARPSLVSRLVRRLRPSGDDLRRRDRAARARFVEARVASLANERARPLLVVLEHARQRIETSNGARHINPFLGPIVDALRGGPLHPIELDLRAKLDDGDAWERLTERGGERLLPAFVISGASTAEDHEEASTAAADEAAATRIAATAVPLVVAGVDLGPTLAAHVAEQARQLLPAKRRAVRRIQALLRRLRPAGVLLADEYHRQDWLIAAAAEGVPVAAVQHGIIHRFHNGYIHATRPSTLRLPARTYVFGRWERELLLEHSVYGPAEVVVGGSPRLDIVRPGGATDRATIRAALGVAPADRLVVVSGTHGAVIRRFQLPMALAAMVDRPLPEVHVVVKLHPGERDEGPYRATLTSASAANGHAPPPITIVRDADLYALLAAADAHVGIHSTVLTEAVLTGTPNLIFASFASADQLGYVEAGVAVPFRSGSDVLAVLDGSTGTADPAARTAFIDAHMEPGSASRRIAGDLVAWLT